jgi:hypothetical protein
MTSENKKVGRFLKTLCVLATKDDPTKLFLGWMNLDMGEVAYTTQPSKDRTAVCLKNGITIALAMPWSEFNKLIGEDWIGIKEFVTPKEMYYYAEQTNNIED